MAQKQTKEVKSFNVTMTPELINKFEEIKEAYGITSDAQGIRLMITLYYNILKSKKNECVV